MRVHASFIKHELRYVKPVRTSRGEMAFHTVYYVKLHHEKEPGVMGLGEASPLPGLSIDHSDHFERDLTAFCAIVNEGVNVKELDLKKFPSIRFAFETAELGLQSRQSFLLYESPFLRGEGIPINGLVWMAEVAQMLAEAEAKVASGFTCIKFKIGALDFDEECRMLERFRKKHSAFKITIRLDANGAFAPEDAMQQLKDLRRFEVHSIEQPIRTGQYDKLEALCAQSPVDVALDEELIGYDLSDGFHMLKSCRPAYIILKPTLLGGLSACNTWIQHAQKLNIGYWATSALESNIGLNAIAQWAATLDTGLPQGLGTGALYSNNISSPLTVRHGQLFYEDGARTRWQDPFTSLQVNE